MPTTFNGFGTTYSKHLNVNARPGVCEQCHQEVRLESFDTHLAVAVLFAPVIKLSAKRITDWCPLCNRHRIIDAKVWRRTLDDVVARARAVFADEQANGAAVVEAAASVALIGDSAAWTAVVAPFVEGVRSGRFAEDADVLAALARFCLDAGEPLKAIELYTASLAVRRDDDVAEQLGFVHLLLIEPQKAQPLLEHIWRNRKVQSLSLATLLVDAWQTVADHDAALRVIERLTAAFPTEMKHNDLVLMKAISERERGRKSKVFRPRLRRQAFPTAVAAAGKGATASSLSTRERLIVATFVAALGGAWVLLGLHVQNSHDVVIVGGAAHKYAVEIDGETLQLHPGAHIERSLALRPHTVVAHAPSGQLVRGDFDDSVNVLLAPLELFTHHIINPDSCAVFINERSEYSSRDTAEKEYNWDIMTGDVWYRSQADFLFVPYPSSIKSERATVKTRLSLPKDPIGDGPALVLDARGAEAARALLQRRLAFDPGDEAAAHALEQLANNDAAAPNGGP